MPKHLLPIEKTSLLDKDEIGEKYSSFAYLHETKAKFPEGFFLKFSFFQEVLSPHLKSIQKLFETTKFSSVSQEFLENLREILKPKIVIESKLLTNITKEVSELKFPIKVEALVKTEHFENEQEIGIIASKEELEKTLVEGLLSFLTKGNLKKIGQVEELEKVLVNLKITQVTLAEASGKATIFSPKKNLVKIQALFGHDNQDYKEEIEVEAITANIINKKVHPQTTQILLKNKTLTTLAIPEKFQTAEKLNSSQVKEIVRVLCALQSKFFTEINTFFQISRGEVIFQSFEADDSESIQLPKFDINLPIVGNLKPLFPGLATGVVKKIEKLSDFKKIRPGQIAVVNTLKKENLVFLKKASGVIVKNTAKLQQEHAHLINQLGISMALGDINSYLEGVITLDGKTGKVYKGSFFPLVSKVLVPKNKEIVPLSKPKTATKIFVYSSHLELLKKADNENADGVGPVHIDLHLTRNGIHPKKALNKLTAENEQKELLSHLETVCEKFIDKPFIYQLTDLKTNYLLSLQNSKEYETKEANPLLGLRGTERALRDKEILNFELSLVRILRNRLKFKNVWISLPFVRNKQELLEMKKILSSHLLHRSPNFKLLVTVAAPSNLFSLEEFLKVGIDGFLIDYWELTNLMYAKDFSYQELTQIEDCAIEEALEKIVKFANKNSLFTSIYNLPNENKNDIIKKLIFSGIKSISIGNDLVSNLRTKIASVEHQLVTNK